MHDIVKYYNNKFNKKEFKDRKEISIHTTAQAITTMELQKIKINEFHNGLIKNINNHIQSLTQVLENEYIRETGKMFKASK